MIQGHESRGKEWSIAIDQKRENIWHYFDARLSDQFDAVIHFDETNALEPLERYALWETGEPPETFPTGVKGGGTNADTRDSARGLE
jgi:hypothetical protein